MLKFAKGFRSEILSDFRRLEILSGWIGCRPPRGRCRFRRVLLGLGWGVGWWLRLGGGVIGGGWW